MGLNTLPHYLILIIAFACSNIFAMKQSYAAITISEVMPMSFGALAIPTSSSSITLSETGGGLSGTGTVLKDTSSRGQYTITGDQSQTVTIEIQNINTGSGSLTLDNFKGVFGGQSISSFPAGTLSLPPGVGKTLYLGARLQFDAGVQEQTYIMTFDLVVNYD